MRKRGTGSFGPPLLFYIVSEVDLLDDYIQFMLSIFDVGRHAFPIAILHQSKKCRFTRQMPCA